MKLKISATLDYAMDMPADLLVQIEAAYMPSQKILEERFDPGETDHLKRIASEDSIGTRVWLRCSDRLVCSYHAVAAVERPNPDLESLPQDPVHLLPHEAVRYLMASRYCPSDEFQSFVQAEFGKLSGGTAVKAMADWIKNSFTYAPGSSYATTTALDTFVQRRGICRDFAHVMITLARAAGIPARMVSAYGPDVEPQDFHALAEVWLDGGWHLIDPTGMTTPDRVAIIGVGRDAADIAFLTSYGWVELRNQVVAVDEIE